MKYEFAVEIKKQEGMDACYIEIPLDVEKEFGAKRVKVKAMLDGAEYRGSIVRMGLPCYMLGITKEIRNKIGKQAGDIIQVEIEKDEEERIIILPQDFAAALEKNTAAQEFYQSLSYSGQRKYFQWVDSAKKEETRSKRVAEAVERLARGEKIL